MTRSLLLAGAAALGLSACASTTDDGMAADGAMSSSSAPMDGGSMNAERTVTVGGAPMYPSKNIVDNAVMSADHKTLVAAVQAADLVTVLQGPGPFTVFAPTDAAFGKLPAGTVESLMQPANKATLTKILTYHVVPGRLSAAQLTNGQRLTTVQGETLTVAKTGNMVRLRDARGGESMVTIADVFQSNGVIHVVDTVVMPAA